MVENKLGIRNYSKLQMIEKELVSTKIKLLDEQVTFNMETLNLEFLIKLHYFLFGDIYFQKDLEIRTITDLEYKKLNKLFELLVQMGLEGIDIKYKSLEIILKKIWELQLFGDGNTRTVLAFLKLYIKYYNLPLEFDFDVDIKFSEKIFVLRKCQQK